MNDNTLLSSESENSETDNNNKAFELSSTSTSDYETPSSSRKITAQQNHVCLKQLAMVCEKYEVSDRAGAATASATLKALKIVTEEDRKYVVDRSKLRRGRQKHREEIREKEEELFHLVDSIYIHGRKDATMTLSEGNGKYYRQTIIEEHYVIVGEPSCFYLSYVTPEDGTGDKVVSAETLTKTNI